MTDKPKDQPIVLTPPEPGPFMPLLGCPPQVSPKCQFLGQVYLTEDEQAELRRSSQAAMRLFRQMANKPKP